MRKVAFRGDEAAHEITVLREIEEMAGMNVNVFVVEQGESEIFVGARSWDAQDGVPAAFHGEAGANFLRCELAVELDEIPPDAGEELRLEAVPLGEKRGHGQLNWGVHRQVGVSDDFEPSEGFAL